jgi:hypothetical protein
LVATGEGYWFIDKFLHFLVFAAEKMPIRRTTGFYLRISALEKREFAIDLQR